MKPKSFYAGIDIGSLSSEALILSYNRILSYSIMPSGPHPHRTAIRCLNDALAKAQLEMEEISAIVATGYGRIRVPFSDRQITEITCHARGAHYLFPKTHTVIDIGGQDSKVITIDDNGNVTDFAMNDKCAAGTGRFLEVMANALDVNLEDMGIRSIKARKGVNISSMCTVFAESEVISLIADGHRPEEIMKGLHQAISRRVFGMAKRLRIIDEITFTGGVAKNIGIVETLNSFFKKKINVPEEPQIVGALGAALCAMEMALKRDR